MLAGYHALTASVLKTVSPAAPHYAHRTSQILTASFAPVPGPRSQVNTQTLP